MNILHAEINSLMHPAHLSEMGVMDFLEICCNWVSSRKRDAFPIEKVKEIIVTDVMLMDYHAARMSYFIKIIFANELVPNHETFVVLKCKCQIVREVTVAWVTWWTNKFIQLIIMTPMGSCQDFMLLMMTSRGIYIWRTNIPAINVYTFAQEQSNCLFLANIQIISYHDAAIFPEVFQVFYTEPLLEMLRKVRMRCCETWTSVIVHILRQLLKSDHSVPKKLILVASLRSLVVDKLLCKVLFNGLLDILLASEVCYLFNLVLNRCGKPRPIKPFMLGWVNN